jgi:acetyl-CoA carboxylase biotin carboxyl carrier protein
VTDDPGSFELDQSTVHALLEAFDKSDWLELSVSVGNDRLYVSRRAQAGGAPQVVPAPSPPTELGAPVHSEPVPPETQQPLTGTVIESPSVGLFWRSPAPGAPPFVEVGGQVSAGDTLAIVEVMKLMSHVVAPAPGTIEAILAENGARVEYGQPLFTIEPGG